MKPRLMISCLLLLLAAGFSRPVLAQNGPLEAYERVATWQAQPQPRAPGELTDPAGIDVADDGTIVVVDRAAEAVHVLGPDGAGRAVFGGAGTGPGEFREPTDVDADDGRLYVTDTGNARVQVLEGGTGRFIAAWEGLGRPRGIAVSEDRVYLTDAERPRVLVLDRGGAPVAEWGPGAVGGQRFVAPAGIAVDRSGHVFVADPGQGVVHALDRDGRSLATWERGASGPDYRPIDVASDGGAVYTLAPRQLGAVDNPVGGDGRGRIGAFTFGAQGLAVGPGDGLVLTVRDTRASISAVARSHNRVLLSRPLESWGGLPVPVGELTGPRRIASAAGGGAYLLDAWPRVQHWARGGAPAWQLGVIGATDVAPDTDGGAYVVEGRAVSRVRADGTAIWRTTEREPGAWFVAADAGDDLVVADAGLGRLLRYTPDGRVATHPLDGVVVDIATGGDRVLLADRGAGAVRSLDAAGTETGRWVVPARVMRVAGARDGSAWFALTDDGWVWKYAPDGTLRAAWDGAPEGRPVDLDVDAEGRVLVVDGENDRVYAYARDVSALPPTVPPGGRRCDLRRDKSARPASVTVGETVEVTLALSGECPGEAVDQDIVLVMDRSGSMTGPKIEAAKSAAVAFAHELDPARAHLGLVAFSGEAELLQSLTADSSAVVRAVADLDASGGTEIGPAIDLALAELRGGTARADALPVIVLMTDGRPERPALAREAAASARASGVNVFTVGLGGDVDGDLLRDLAGSPDQYFEAPTESELATVFTRIARRLGTSTLLTSITVVDVVPRNMTFVAGSAFPPADWNSASRTLRWTLDNVSPAGFRLRYEVRPQQSGTWPTNVRAHGDYTDGVGAEGRVVFPVPTVVVEGDQSVYLPVALSRRCSKQRFDIALVIDTSSSMYAGAGPAETSKLDAARGAARRFVDLMALPADQVAVVAFNDRATLVQPLTGDRGALDAALDGLPLEPGTRIDRGLRQAFDELLSPRRRAGSLPVAILLTDGQPAGGTKSDALAAATLMRQAGVTVFAIGLGADADGGLLIELTGDPWRYRYAPSPSDLVQIYRDIAWQLPCP